MSIWKHCYPKQRKIIGVILFNRNTKREEYMYNINSNEQKYVYIRKQQQQQQVKQVEV